MILMLLNLDHLEISGVIHGSNCLADFYSFPVVSRENAHSITM